MECGILEDGKSPRFGKAMGGCPIGILKELLEEFAWNGFVEVVRFSGGIDRFDGPSVFDKLSDFRERDHVGVAL